MKGKLYLYLILPLLMVFYGTLAIAMPRYTDKETALAMAKVLDKGTFGRYTISSTYVQNDSVKDYYISAILSDGSAHKWYINEVYNWTRDDKLNLANNRSLLFLDPRDTRFVVLDKNDFHRLALKANVYVKVYGESDPLEGKKFKFKIKSFNLISPTETAFGRDETGSKYRYVIDLFNGMRELLTYESAYLLVKSDYLKVDKQPDNKTFGPAYHITKILAHKKGKIENGVAQFGIEVEFDQGIALNGEQFPIEIYEKKTYNRRTKRYDSAFVLDITVPNAEKKFTVTKIKSLEYLHNIEVVKNTRHSKRLYLRATFNPGVMDIPPVIYKNSDNSVYVNFFALIDQSVMSRGMLLQAKKREQAERDSMREIKVTKAIKTDSDYGRAFISAVETHKQSQGIRDAQTRIAKLIEGVKQFEEAALYAETDAQLYNALTKRNELRESVIILTIELIKSKLGKEDLGGTNVKALMDRLDLAESYTGKAQVLKQIEKLREKLIASQQ